MGRYGIMSYFQETWFSFFKCKQVLSEKSQPFYFPLITRQGGQITNILYDCLRKLA